MQFGSRPYCTLLLHLPGKWTSGPSQAQCPGPLPIEDKRAGWLPSLLVPPPVQGQLPVCRDRHCCSGKGKWPSRWIGQAVPTIDSCLAKQLAGNTVWPLIKGATGLLCPKPGQDTPYLSQASGTFQTQNTRSPVGQEGQGQGAWEGAQGLAERLDAQGLRLGSGKKKKSQWSSPDLPIFPLPLSLGPAAV